ncbi:MAG: ATP-binding protein [Myxococcota bacterium]
MAIGIVALFGWTAGWQPLFRVFPEWASMKVNTALGVACLGAALLAAAAPRWRRAAPAFAVAALALAGTSLLEEATGLDLGIDQVLLTDPYTHSDAAPGRMSIATAIALALLALSLLAASVPRPRPIVVQALAGAGFAIGHVGLLGYAYDARALAAADLFDTLSLPTALSILTIGAGVLCLWPSQGPMAAFTGDDPGAEMLRALTPAVLLVPAATGFVASRSGQPPGFAFAASAVLNTLALCALLGTIAAAARHARARQLAAEADALAREQHLATTLDSIGDGVIATDVTGRVTRINPVATHLTGWEPAEAVGRPLAEVYTVTPEVSGTPMEDPVSYVLRVGARRGLANHSVLTDRQGKQRPVIDCGAPIRAPGGQVEGVVLVFSDQTAEREAEARLRQAQKTEAVGRLAGGIVHDFNNMLSVIVGYVSFAREEEPSPAIRADLDEALGAADTAAALTRQLLAFARPSLGTPAVVDVNDLVRRSEHLLARTLGDRVRVSVDIGVAPALVQIDPDLLTQVLLNLAINARDAMPNGGDLKIGVASARLDDEHPSERVRLVVSDTGVGMPPEVRERLFEPFFTTKGPSKGTGLGLSTTASIIAHAGGAIEVESAPGAGTTFRITLPGSLEEAASTSAEPSPFASARGETVLVAENEPAIRDVMARLLRRAGYDVITAGGVEEARSIARTHDGPIHLLLTDEVMTDGFGTDLARTLQVLRPKLRVLVVTGHGDDELARRLTALRAVQVIRKPFRPDALLTRMRRVLDQT